MLSIRMYFIASYRPLRISMPSDSFAAQVDYESPLSPVVPRGTTGHPTELDVRTYMRKWEP